MKAFIAVLLLVGSAYADGYVNGYYRKDGTYVAPHFRSSPDSTRFNNFSTNGNVNPYTGTQGTKNPYSYQNPYFYQPKK